MNHLSLHPTLRTCSSDTILRAIKELTKENISYTSDAGKNYDFNTADTLNTLLLNCMFASGHLKEGEMYDVDFDHQFIETDGVQDFWEGEYTYRCILTNDYESSTKEIVEFYNLRGGKERFR